MLYLSVDPVINSGCETAQPATLQKTCSNRIFLKKAFVIFISYYQHIYPKNIPHLLLLL